MQKLWFITNPNSGSATKAKCDALEAVFEERGLELVGRTGFPEAELPDADALDAAGVDTVVLFAGDGTINAALCKLSEWGGAFLILPGGTMNLLAKSLHDDLDPHKIVHAAHEGGLRVALPYVEAGPHRGFVGLIVGPAASWFRPREDVRKHRLRQLFGSIRIALRRTFGRDGIRVRGVPGLSGAQQAIFVTPGDGALDVVGVDARDWASIVELGWDWLTGDWVAANAVTHTHSDRLWIRGTRRVLALFDGEPVTLRPHEAITGGKTRPAFIATREREDA